jgi:hypothetical protein
MQDDRWNQLIALAKKNFKNVSLEAEDLIASTPDGPQKQGTPQYQSQAPVRGTQDVLIFESPLGHFKLVRENRPAVLEKKEFYTHRAGQSARTEYKLSETEFSHKLRVYKEAGFEEWDEITLDKLGL